MVPRLPATRGATKRTPGNRRCRKRKQHGGHISPCTAEKETQGVIVACSSLVRFRHPGIGAGRRAKEVGSRCRLRKGRAAARANQMLIGRANPPRGPARGVRLAFYIASPNASGEKKKQRGNFVSGSERHNVAILWHERRARLTPWLRLFALALGGRGSVSNDPRGQAARC